MDHDNLNKKYDLASIIILALIAIFSFIRFDYLPQFIDGYYHLACSNAFIKSGGWCSVDWWFFAPSGRPHMYPPVYHLILVFLQSLSFSGLTALRITEVLIVPMFFSVVWFVFRRQISSRFSFFFLLTATSFFSFYTSVSANIPASIAIILGVLSWSCFKNKKYLSSAVFMVICFYTHAGMPWVFFISYLVLAFLDRSFFKTVIFMLLAVLFCSMPILFHNLSYAHYLKFNILREILFVHYSVFIVLLGLVSLFYLHKRKSLFQMLFAGYLLGSLIIFFKYPYRFFSAQGALGFIFLLSLFLSDFFKGNLNLSKKIVLLFLFTFLFFFHPTIDKNEGKNEINYLNSTYYNIYSGKFADMLEFSSFFYPKKYTPLVEVIQKNSGKNDIISSNNKIFAQILASLSDRPSSQSMLAEVCVFVEADHFRNSKLIIWLKPDYISLNRLKKRLNLLPIYQNDISLVFLNQDYLLNYSSRKADISFNIIVLVFVFLCFIFIVDMLKLYNILKVINEPRAKRS